MRINLDYLHYCSNLRRLLTENPKLPVIVYAGENANTGDYQYLCCSRVECSVGEVLDCELPFGGKEVFYDRDYFRERLADYLAEQLGGLTDDEFDKALKKELKKYEPYWKKVIEVWVDN